jgi:hypothetical protein
MILHNEHSILDNRRPHSAVLQNGFEEVKQRRNDLLVDAEFEVDILAWRPENFEKHTPITPIEICPFCSAKLNNEIAKGWIDSFIGRYRIKFIEVMSPS